MDVDQDMQLELYLFELWRINEFENEALVRTLYNGRLIQSHFINGLCLRHRLLSEWCQVT